MQLRELELLERLLSDQLLEKGKLALRAHAYERSAQLRAQLARLARSRIRPRWCRQSWS